MTPLVFSHANSFGASTYRVLFKALKTRGFAVSAIDQLGHAPRYPVTNNWPHLVQHLVDFIEVQADQAGGPVYLAGHSLGGFLSAMVASKAPELVRGVVLLDAPLIGGWRATALGAAKTTPLYQTFSPASVSRKRRNSWADKAAVMAHFQHKKSFTKWDPQVLQDYVDLGTRDEPSNGENSRVLSFNREIETAIYNGLPHNMDALFRRHPIKCPVAFIGGLQSAEIKQVGMALTEKVCKNRLMMLDGTHLFPMEKPQATAAAIEAALLNMAA
ncbi:alpha/beta fold hydrolase [Rhodoferax sp. PAMC 29310]|uniref:alpha/beta fold hydrolase n=1 Tax=Rhodoferax sp. PAMC 29310 TaxID=2822760 RepID=UPI001B32DE65|nr:alpha/beta hydrolase [Rhodoferax sp. PAMC 29310]